jgi:hypothetical protein
VVESTVEVGFVFKRRSIMLQRSTILQVVLACFLAGSAGAQSSSSSPPRTDAGPRDRTIPIHRAEVGLKRGDDHTASGKATSQFVGFQAPDAAPVPREGIGNYSPGGRNVMVEKYTHSIGYPRFPDRAKFIGTLQGTWYEMGRQFGERSGDAVRCVSDIWWRQQCDQWGRHETIRAMALYEAQIRLFDPGLIDFMKGVADGASPWLDQSRYAEKEDPWHGTDYQRVLAVNIYDEWSMRHPHQFPDGSSTYGGTAKPSLRNQAKTCSGFSARGKVTSGGIVLAAQNRHCPYDPRCYQQVYVLQPEGGVACWVLTNCPQVAANQVVNECGVSIALFAGGSTNQRSLHYRGGEYYAEGFGVPWFHLFLYAGTHSRTAEEAIKMLTVGTAAYRDRTGRKTLLRGGGWIFLVTDGREMAVVEATADRYAIRRPGEFCGPGWTDQDYIVATNHNLCDYSYDGDNCRTSIPMTIFGDAYSRDPKTGTITGQNGSGIRFWTLMWDIRHRYGKVDEYVAQHIMSGLHACNEKTGKEIKVARDEAGIWRVWGNIRPCNQGTVSLDAGSADGKVSVLQGNRTVIYWTMGSPSHWQGAWDAFRFNE